MSVLTAVHTCLQGTINVDSDTLVRCFGEPDPDYCDPMKTDAEWRVARSSLPYLISIYNWKNGKNYLGENGLPVEEITQWNIGGQKEEDVETILKAIDFFVPEKTQFSSDCCEEGGISG